MTNLDVGTNGATGQSWNRNNPRPILEKLIKESMGDPRLTANRSAIFAEFKQVALADHDILATIIEYWFQNNYNSLLREAFETPTPSPVKTKAVKQRVAAVKQEIKERVVNFVLLDLTMPNGKAMRDCTGLEMRKAGGQFLKIANKVGPKQIVGQVLSEAQVKRLIKEK